MMKKNIVVVILLLIVIVALIIGLRAAGIIGTDRAPDEVAARPITVIDTESLQLIEVSAGEWDREFEVDPATGYKIDNEGRKLAIPVTCRSCGEQTVPMPEPEDADQDELDDAMLEHTCTECGNLVY